MNVFVYVDMDNDVVKCFNSFEAASDYAQEESGGEIEWSYSENQWSDDCYTTIYKLPIESYKKTIDPLELGLPRLP